MMSQKIRLSYWHACAICTWCLSSTPPPTSINLLLLLNINIFLGDVNLFCTVIGCWEQIKLQESPLISKYLAKTRPLKNNFTQLFIPWPQRYCMCWLVLFCNCLNLYWLITNEVVWWIKKMHSLKPLSISLPESSSGLARMDRREQMRMKADVKSLYGRDPPVCLGNCYLWLHYVIFW